MKHDEKPAEAKTPVVETPKVETPVVETPVVETPKVETPVVETPVVESTDQAPQYDVVVDEVVQPDGTVKYVVRYVKK